MMMRSQYGELASQAEIEGFGRILDQCFISLSGQGEKYIQRVGQQRCRVIRNQDGIIGGLAVIPLGQWWGNSCVEMGGIAAVGIGAEFRGVGAAKLLMRSVVKEMYTSGLAISVLFPATEYLYRQVGYEQAGVACVWEIDTQKIQVREQPLQLTQVRTDDISIFTDLYDQQAQFYNGYLRRDRFLWSEKFRSGEETVYAYLIGDQQQPKGYIIYSQHSRSEGNVMRVRDWVLLNRDAVKSFWSFLANTRSQINQIRWRDAGITPLTLELPEQNERLADASKWMLRVVNVIKALEQRGYPAGLTTELHLQVEDDLIAENNGNFLLKIVNGKAEVQPGGNGDLKLDIRTLAPLYTSLFTPQQLHSIGKINANPTLIAIATQIFTGTVPSISDYF